MQHPALRVVPLVVLAIACRTATEPTAAPEAVPFTSDSLDLTGAFTWRAATPESQGMCGSTRQLGCTKTLLQIWTDISNPKHNTKRFIVIRNDKVLFDRGGTLAYPGYSATKGLLGAPALVHAMSKCGVGLNDRVAQWLDHGDGARWGTTFPWTNITVEHLATHTSGVCDYSNKSSVCRNENAGWQAAYDRADMGGTNFLYPNDAFTIARKKAEQNRQPALSPGSILEYSNVGHGLLGYAIQSACGQKLSQIFDLYIKQAGMGSPVSPAQIYTDGGKVYNQSTGIARWRGLDGASVLRLAGRLGIWENRNIEPVRFWNVVSKITGNIPAAAAEGWGVVYENNSRNMWTQTQGHKRLSLATFGHGGNYSTIFQNDPLTGTIIVRQGENNAKGASYLTLNGCAPGWTGTAPTCTAGTNWSNNWGEPSVYTGQRKKVMEPVQEAFFFPPPFCRMTAAAGQMVDNATDIYASPSSASSIDLRAEITIDPREDAGSSEEDRVEFYKESGGGIAPQYIGQGTRVAGTTPTEYRLSYDASSHGAVGDVRTYFASCVARSTVDRTKKVPSYSRPVRIGRR